MELRHSLIEKLLRFGLRRRHRKMTDSGHPINQGGRLTRTFIKGLTRH
jgi:hypothetical protein